MKQVYSTSDFKNTQLIDDNDPIPDGFTDQVPMIENPDGTYTGFYQPEWNGSGWVEGGTAPTQAPQPPSFDDRLSAVESAISSLMGV